MFFAFSAWDETNLGITARVQLALFCSLPVWGFWRAGCRVCAGGSVFAGLAFFWGWLVRVGSPPAVVGWVGSACPLPWLLVQGCSVCILLLGVVGFLGGYGLPPPGWGAVNRLGVISFSIYGLGLLYFFSNPLPVWLVLTAFNG